MELEISRWSLPTTSTAGYGSALVRVPGTTVVKRLRMGAPALVYALPDGRHRCWSAHNAVATGERQDMAGVPNVWDVLPRHLSVFDAWTLAELHRTAAPPHRRTASRCSERMPVARS